MGLLTDLISKVGLDTRDFEKKLDRAGRKLTRQGRRMSLVGNDLTNNVSLPLAAMGGFAIKAAADIERLELALKNTMGAGYIQELEKLKEIAKDPGLGFEQAVKGSVALQAVGASAEYARNMMQIWGNAVAAAGGTAVELDRVVTQLQQALSKQGNLLREDWKFIVQSAPQAQKALMSVYGTGSLEEISKMGVDARTAIAAITKELGKLDKVQGGIANKFINFSDQIKQALVPLGKMIFESSDLQGIMATMISTVTKLGKGFGSMSEGMKKFVVQAGIGLILFGPFLRTMGSFILIWKQFYVGILKVLLGGRKFIDWTIKATSKTNTFIKAITASRTAMLTAGRAAAGFSGALAGISAMAFGAINGIRGIFREIKAGKGQLETLREFQGIGVGAYNFQIAQGLDRSAPDPKKFANAAESLKILNGPFNIFNDEVEESNKNLPKFVQLMTAAAYKSEDATKGTTKWGEALGDLNEELRTIGEMEKLTSQNMNEDRVSAYWSAIKKGISDFGMSADSPAIKGFIGNLKDIRGEVQGIVKEIPKLNLLPKALSPTGGIPDAGANNVGRIQDLQKKLMGATKKAWAEASFSSMDNAVVEGLATMQEASMNIYENYGSQAAQAYIDGFRQRINEMKGVVAIDMQGFMQDVAGQAAYGLGEAFGSIMSGEDPTKSMIESFLIPLADMIKQFGSMLIAAGTAAIKMKALFLNPVAAIGAGIAAVAIGQAAKNHFQNKLASLAEGGIATGPTQALVGDNPRSPELITPLHKLPGLMRDIMGGQGGKTVRIMGNFEIDGDKLSYFIDEQLDLRRSLSMY